MSKELSSRISVEQNLEQRIFEEQVSLLYAQYTIPAFIGSVVTFVVLYVLWGHVPATLLLAWFVGQNICLASGYVGAKAFDRDRRKTSFKSWYRRYLVNISVIGLFWGSLAVFLVFDLSLVNQVFLIIVAVGAACSALVLAIPALAAYYLFLGSCLLPTIAWLLAQYPNPVFVIGVNGAFFIGMLAVAGRNLNKHLVNKIKLNFENASLLSEVNQLNESLESRVRIKTRALYESEERFHLAMQGANDGLWDWDIVNRQVYFSPRWSAMLGYGEGEIRGQIKEWRKRLHPEDRRDVLRRMGNHLKGTTRSYESVHRIRHKNGSYLWVLDRARAVIDNSGIACRMVGTQVDLSQQKKLEEKLKSANLKLKHEAKERLIAQNELAHLAKHDPLTDLPNRLYFYDQLQEAIHYAEKNGDAIAVLLVDLDNFKHVNDTLGHPLGDRLLVDVSKRLTAIVNKNYFLSRFGGDEFLVILRDCSDTFLVEAYAREIIDLVSKPFFIDDHEIRIGCSIGITLFPDHGKQPDKLIRDADIAMYHAKKGGKNAYSYFTEEMDQEISEKGHLRSRLHGALDRNEFEVFYQPQVDIESGRITGIEALLRWNVDDVGNVSPEKFVPLLEDSGLISEVGNWVMREACRVAVAIRSTGMSDLKIAVNASPRQFLNPGFTQQVKDILQETGMEAEYLEIEITENIFLEDLEAVHESLQTLKEIGVQITIDDFGTGYSSLGYLTRFPITGIKIDKVFIKDLLHNNDSKELVTAIIEMTKGLKLATLVAEGVEKKEQLDVLRKAGCPTFQGYYYSKPVVSDELFRLCSKQNRLKSV